jgi:hypothetical protein
VNNPNDEWRRCDGRLGAMQDRSLLKVGIVIALSIIGLALVWIVLLGPAAVMLVSPRT